MNEKTILGPKREKQIVAELEPIIQKFAKKTKIPSDQVRSSVAYLWEDEKRQAEQSWKNYLSANDLGPYQGR